MTRISLDIECSSNFCHFCHFLKTIKIKRWFRKPIIVKQCSLFMENLDIIPPFVQTPARCKGCLAAEKRNNQI
jgi:hypothetical protein